MAYSPQQIDGKKLLRDGWTDEDVERLTGLDLESIVLLRAEAASAAYRQDQWVAAESGTSQAR